jgi:Carboxypeptidase regulatory-like domain
VLAVVLCFATPAMSQTFGVITGRIVDSSGARIPGVTITTTSTALQGERVLVSDEGGNYRFESLPPGTFVVKYELPGFKTLIRDGIIVVGGGTVTLNPQLEVATVAETVTVTGESPVVDLEQAKIGVNFSSAIKDNAVNARNYWALLSQTPGMKTTTPDVGGSTMGTQVGYRAYGFSGQVKIKLDGVDLTEGNGSGSMYGDYGSWEEVNVSSAGNGAEMATAGTSLTAVIRSGGNTYHGGIVLNYEDDSFQGQNIDAYQRNAGISVGDAFTRYTDFNVDLGGRFIKDKFWHYTSYRNEYSGLSTQMRQSGGAKYVLPASGIAPNLCSQLPCLPDSPDGSPAGGLFYTRLRNLTHKLTYQINQNNSLNASANVRLKFQPYRGGSGGNARFQTPETTQQQESWFHIFKVQWVSTLSNRATLDVSLNNFGYYWVNLANTTGTSIQDRTSSGPLQSYLQGPFNQNLNNNRRWTEDVVFSYFFNGGGGSHNLKVGYSYLWEDYRGSTKGYPNHIRYVFNNGNPDRVIIQNTPVQWVQNGLMDNSFYVQDKWQIGRKLTLNLGLRFDRYTAFLPEQHRESAGGNIWASQGPLYANLQSGLSTFGNNHWDQQTIGIFNKPVPRFSFIYDVFGDGKTAIKASYGLFTWNPSYDLSGNALDNDYRTATYNWNGTLPMASPADLSACIAAGGCSLQSAPNLTQTRIDPNLELPKTHEYTFGIDQQLYGDLGVRFNFVRKIQRGGYGTINQQYAISDYVPFQYRDIGIDGTANTPDDQIITLYNRTVGTRPNDPLLTYSDGAGDMARTFEIEGVKRMSHRWQFIAGADWTKRDAAASLFTTDPNTLVFQNNAPGNHYWDWTGKLIGTYDFPAGIQFNTSFRSQKGEATSRTIAVNCTAVVNVGQTCAQAGGTSLRQGSISALTVVNSGMDGNFYPAQTLWDLGLKKTFQISERLGKIDANFDLFNLLNANTVRAWNTSSSSLKTLQDGTKVPNFHIPTGILNARIFRLGMHYSF